MPVGCHPEAVPGSVTVVGAATAGAAVKATPATARATAMTRRLSMRRIFAVNGCNPPTFGGLAGQHSSRSGPDCPILDGLAFICRLQRRDLLMQDAQRLDEDLRERRERLDRVAQDVERHAGADGERGLLEPFAGLRAEGVGAREPLAVAEQLQ